MLATKGTPSCNLKCYPVWVHALCTVCNHTHLLDFIIFIQASTIDTKSWPLTNSSFTASFWQDLLAILTLFFTRMFILESSQTPLHQTCLAGTDLFFTEADNRISQILPSVNSCIFTTKHCQVPHLLPIEKAHLRAGRVSYRGALLAVLCPHKGMHRSIYQSWHVDSGICWNFYHLILIFFPIAAAAAGVVRVGCDYADSITDPQQQRPVVLGWSII